MRSLQVLDNEGKGPSSVGLDHMMAVREGARRRVHFHRPVEKAFTADQRDETTILFGGLTPRHDALVEASFRGLGYRGQALPNVSLDGYERAKEYGNNGQCNPTYFTVGNLIKYLQDREAEGMSRKEIVDRYVYFTAGCAGTCRFGMYEAEYRLALANAGFEGFRLVLFSNDGGIQQSKGGRPGVDLDLDFFFGLINAFNLADVVNQLLHKVRAYEVTAGDADRAMGDALALLYRAVQQREPLDLGETRAARWLSRTRLERIKMPSKVVDQMRRRDLVEAMARVRERFDEVEVDPFAVKPIVKITGEFWAQVTESAGNFDMHRFLEREGAEVFVDRPLFTRILYLLFQHKERARESRGLHGVAPRNRLREWRTVAGHYSGYLKKRGLMTLAEWILRRETRRLIDPLGGILHEAPDQYELERLSRPYFDWRTCSGEGHLEVAENLYYHQNHLCHMVLSVKPFTCMPSTQSDGVQARVVEDFPGMIFLPIETSGDGEVIAHSRVQMALGSARQKARAEWQRTLEQVSWSLHDMRGFVDDHPELRRSTYTAPHAPGVVGRAANFALHVSDLMDRRPTSLSMSQGRRRSA